MRSAPGFQPPTSDFWVFAYGSLMWHPDFPFDKQRHATVHGYHRALCVYSWVYRGTEDDPGLVFGLARGGAVKGVAFHVRAADAANVYATLFAREMVSNVYRPHWSQCRLTCGTPATVPALAFVADPTNPQYAGRLCEAETLELIRCGCGKAGACRDYVVNTATHLREMGIRDLALERIVKRLER